MPAITLLPLDLKGTKLTNRIANEARTLVRVDSKPHRVLIPKFGAFYNDENLKIYDGARRLVHGTDYVTTYLYRDLAMLASKPVYAFIVIINAAVSNSVVLNYHAVGGNFGINVDELQALLDAINPDNFRVNYEDIVNKPKGFNPAPHMDEYWQLYGAENTVTVLNRVRDLLAKNDEAIVKELKDYSTAYHDSARTRLDQEKALLKAHVEDFNNPHVETKTSVGLSNLNNWRMVLASEALNASLDMYYSTPESGQLATAKQLTEPLLAHIARRDNPHGIRASDVSAYTTAQIYAIRNTKLSINGTAINSNLLFGYNLASWKAYVNANINGDLITQGLFSDVMLGGSDVNANYALLGNGTWKSWLTMIQELNATVTKSAILYVRSNVAAYNANNAINYLNANFADLNNYPVGTKAVFMGYRSTGYWVTRNLGEVKFLIRAAGGWTTWLV